MKDSKKLDSCLVEKEILCGYKSYKNNCICGSDKCKQVKKTSDKD